MAQQDPQLSKLLKWSIENSAAGSGAAEQADQSGAQAPRSTLDPAALAALLGGPSDADLMKESMAAIESPEVGLDDKLVAFDNFEQLIESLDNANNMAPLGLWTPLLSQLRHDEADMRRMAAWCVGTAVQNNAAAQERALVGGAVPTLVGMVKGEDREKDEPVRRKARYALSSLVRNYQPGMDAVLKAMGGEQDKVDSGDMEAVDRMLDELTK